MQLGAGRTGITLAMKLLRLVAGLRYALPRIVPLFRNPRVPLWLKLASVMAAVLLISPLDPLADIPIVGLFDDAALLMMVAQLFVLIAERLLAADESAHAYAEPKRVGPAALR